MDSQHTLPLGSVEEVEELALEAGTYLAVDSGFVFANIHNILAEIPAEKVIAMFRAVENILPDGQGR